MKKFYTNGIKTIKLNPEDEIPKGYHLGRTFKVNTWNKGLTKDDPRVKKNTHNCYLTRKAKNNYQSWNKGLSKETNSSLKRVSDKLSKYRLENPLTEDQIRSMCDNIYKTKKKNKSFNTSKPETDYYNYLKTIYDENDIIRQYRDERYPYNCDFYIKSEDLFIELNYTWCHGGHPYNEANEKDKQELIRRLNKSKTSNYYKWSIDVWTKSDVLKLKTFRDNNLNFKIIYPNGLIIQK